MKKSKTKFILLVLFFVLVYALLGYFRDLVFRYTNAQINLVQYGGDPFPFYPGLNFLGILTLQQLLLFKWGLTVLTFLIYAALGLVILKIWHPSKQNYQLWFLAYLACLFLGAVGVLFQKISGSEQGYYFARWIMGAAQSPLIIMIFVVALLGLRKGGEL